MKPNVDGRLIQQENITGVVGGVPVLDRLGSRMTASLVANFLRCGCAGVQCILDGSERDEVEKILTELQLPDERFSLTGERVWAGDNKSVLVLVLRATIPPLP